MTGVLVTRPLPADGAPDPLVATLVGEGLDVVHVPTVAIHAVTPVALVRALRRRPAPDWIVVTSARGAAPLAAAAAGAGGLDGATRVAAVGPGTAAALVACGLRVDHVPARFLTAAIADGLGPLAGRRVVLARADAATPALRLRLAELGAKVEEIVTYRTEEGPADSVPALVAAIARRPEIVTFTSGSTVRGLAELARLAAADPELDRAMHAMAAACIGPVSAAEARRHAFHVVVVADPHTLDALAGAIVAHRSAGEIPA